MGRILLRISLKDLSIALVVRIMLRCFSGKVKKVKSSSKSFSKQATAFPGIIKLKNVRFGQGAFNNEERYAKNKKEQ